jgi:hypothetical protein
MLWLLVFLVVTVSIQARQTSAALTARRLAGLAHDRTALESERAALQRQIRQGMSRQVVVERAEQELGLHAASDRDSRTVRLPRSRR